MHGEAKLCAKYTEQFHDNDSGCACESLLRKQIWGAKEASAICLGAHRPLLPKIIPRRLIASFNTSSRGRAPELSLFHTLSKASPPSAMAAYSTSSSTNTEICQRQVRSSPERK